MDIILYCISVEKCRLEARCVLLLVTLHNNKKTIQIDTHFCFMIPVIIHARLLSIAVISVSLAIEISRFSYSNALWLLHPAYLAWLFCIIPFWFKRLKDVYSWFTESYSYRTSLAIWDHKVLPVIWHKWMCPALTPASKPVLDLPTPEGWKAWVDLGYSYPAMQRWELNSWPLDYKSYVLTTIPLRHPAQPSSVCVKFLCVYFNFRNIQISNTWQILVMADDSEWTKLPTDEKCLHKVSIVVWELVVEEICWL